MSDNLINYIGRKKIAEFLSEYITPFNQEEIENFIEIPPPEIIHTYAFPCYRLAKFEKKNPVIIAEQLIKSFEKPNYFKEITAKGPYINFQLQTSLILGVIFNAKENYGRILKDSAYKQLNIVIEYPSPNTNKPLHLGHVRNMLIGKTISNLFEYFGHKVYQVNLNNDRGIHICKSMLAYAKWGNNKNPDKKSDHFVGDFYVLYNKKVEENPELENEVKEMLKKWEEGNPNVIKLWKKMNKWALDGFHETYEKLGIKFDKEYFESDFYKKGKEKILEGLKKGLFEKNDDGAIYAKLSEKYNLPDKILLRSDGTSIYITQDIYLAYLKKKDFNYDRSIYVVGNEQDLYFKQLFAVLDILGFKEDKFHFSYGMINLPEGKMKSREGKVVDADDIIEEMINLAYQEVNKRYPNLDEEEKKRRAKIIGMGALKFFILKFNPKSDFVFNPEESISFEGETGPYVQYCYARIQSIITKSEQPISLEVNYDLLTDEKELTLIKYLNYFPEIVKQTVDTYNLHLIPQYLLNLCQKFNSFYSSCQVISENKELERARLLLIKCVQIVIKVGLNLLDIETLEEM